MRPLEAGTAHGLPRDPEGLAAGPVHLDTAVVDGHVRVGPSPQAAGGDPVEPVPRVHRAQVQALQRRGHDGAGQLGDLRQVGKILLLALRAVPPAAAHAVHRGYEQQDATEGEQQMQAQPVRTAVGRRQGKAAGESHERGGEGEMVGHAIFPSSTVGRPRKNVAWTRPGSLRPA